MGRGKGKGEKEQDANGVDVYDSAGKDPEKMRKGDMLMERVLADERPLEVIKARMIERLVMESTLESGFVRCVLFFVGFVSMIMMVRQGEGQS